MPLTITIEKQEAYNEDTREFYQIPETKLVLEHSLISISKWESIWHVPFIGNKNITPEQAFSYIKCMTINTQPNEMVYNMLNQEHMKMIDEYMQNPMTAQKFYNEKKGRPGEITSELIYYWMIQLQIPIEFEKWHFNKLYTLIKLCGYKNKDPKKMSKSEALRQHKALNAQRKAKLHTRG